MTSSRTTAVPWTLQVGDILTARTDILVSTANPGFQLTGGIGALLLRRGGAAYQRELNGRARAAFGEKPAPRGSLLLAGCAGLGFRNVIHVVSLDVFYETTPEVLSGCMRDVLLLAEEQGARSIAVPAFATGYGRFDMTGCGKAMRAGLDVAATRLSRLEAVEIWLRTERRRTQYEAGWRRSGDGTSA